MLTSLAPDWSGCGLKKAAIPSGTSRGRRAAESRKAVRMALTFILLNWLCSGIIVAQNIKKETQTGGQEITFKTKNASSFYDGFGKPVNLDNDGKKHYLAAVSGAVATQFLIFGWDRYILRADWAQVTWDDVKTFYKRRPEWDTDWYWTNFVLHPYQGALAYMAGRNSNLNRVESLILTAASDAMWEWFFETNAPAYNDLVYSFVGAFAVGEMLYRLSLEASEINWLLGWAVNPERLWTELWTRQKPRGTTGNIYAFSVRATMGTMHAWSWSKGGAGNRSESFPFYFSPEVYIVYNDPYRHDSNSPYSHFELRMGAGIGKGSGFWRGLADAAKYLMYDIFIFSNGMLFSRSPDWGANRDTSIGMVLDYDFRWHSYMDVSSLAPGFAIKQRISYEGRRIEWQFHGDVNLLGTTDYYHYHRNFDMAVSFRDYSYMVGGETVFLWRLITDSGWMAECDFHGYVARDLPSQTQGKQSPGWEVFGFLDLNLEIPLAEKVRMGLANELYVKKAWYETASDVFQLAFSSALYAKLQLK